MSHKLTRIAALVACLALAAPAQSPAVCADVLLRRWNQFADHANRYIQTLDASAARRDRDRARLRAEWEEVNRCECF